MSTYSTDATTPTTSVPAASLTDEGFVAPAETDILTGVWADLQASFGGNLTQTVNTPQGQLAMSETAIIGDCNDQLLALMNGFDPRTASGRLQDAIAYIFLLTRNTDETRAEFEARRQDTVAANSNGTNAALLGALLKLDGINDAYVADNNTDDEQVIKGVTVPARRLYISTSGASADDIGQAILTHKNPCSMTYGTSSVSATDTADAYNGNGPTYLFYYNEAADTDIYVNVSLTNSTSVPSTALASIQSAVLSVFDGDDDSDTKARIASEIYASAFYSSIAALGTWAKIVEITIGTSASPTDTTVQMTMAQRPVLTAANITLTLV